MIKVVQRKAGLFILLIDISPLTNPFSIVLSDEHKFIYNLILFPAMKTKWWAIVLVLVCTLFTSSAQVLYKIGVKDLSFDLFALMHNYWIIGGLALYGIGAVLLIVGLKGGDLSVLYPIIATGYVWVALYSMYFFGEEMNLFKWLGVFVIIAGIALVGFGSRHSDPVEGVI